jgi:molybdopterin-guanine dinucleotide biosynthesis protein B
MSNNRTPAVLGFAADSGTGKTTLLTQLIPLLKQQGISVGLIKHSHHDFEIDRPGKDSFRLRVAGATPVLLVSSYRQVVITEFIPPSEPCLVEQLQVFAKTSVDLILVEGFKSESFPKIELHRVELSRPLLYPTDPDIIAVASNAELQLPQPLVSLNLNDPGMIASFILDNFLAGLV